MSFPKIEGGGLLFKNDKKQEGDSRPDYKGNKGTIILYLPDQKLEIPVEWALWKKQGQKGTFLSLKVQNAYEPPAAPEPKDPQNPPF
jgi:hypothetical protein